MPGFINNEDNLFMEKPMQFSFLHGKNGFARVSKSSARYRFGNNFVRPIVKTII